MSPAAQRRPILVWCVYIVHWPILLYGLAYASVAFGLLSLGEQFDAQVSRFRLNDHVITLTWIIGCFLAVHYLFIRKPRALAIYLVSSAVFLLPNLVRYVRACLDNRCPSTDFLINLALSASFFIVVALLIALASRSWPAAPSPA